MKKPDHNIPANRAWWSLREFHDKQKAKREPHPIGFHAPKKP